MIIRENISKYLKEKKNLEKKLWESEERYKILFESVPDAIGTIDNKGFITSLNQATIDMT